jgi:hypothetical protein
MLIEDAPLTRHKTAAPTRLAQATWADPHAVVAPSVRTAGDDRRVAEGGASSALENGLPMNSSGQDIRIARAPVGPPLAPPTETAPSEAAALARHAERLRAERRRLDSLLSQVERDLGESQIRVARLEAQLHSVLRTERTS